MLILIADAFDKSLPGKLSVFGEVTDDISRLAEADVILIRSKTKATKEYIDNAKKCRLIIRGGVGMDNIDLAYAKEKGIIATNTPKSSAPAVAEMAFALMLSTASKVCFYDRTMKAGEWAKKTKRSELGGKTLALLGLGNIAKRVATLANAFGMKVQAYDKYVTESDLAELKATPEEAVKDADYISMHLPYTPETDKMVNEDLINKMEKKPVIINTGRGKCVDEAAVAQALKDGRLSWFCTDVYSSEPPVVSENPLFGCENVTFSPHVGANSNENLLRIGQEVYDTIEKLLKEGKI
ncbi:MAG: NAD(P)-dependent oxidoreductase [Spirochaetales bacterium]|uniref:NAD(P)-dependent oxidoreductase n=1 Tax=Bullifex sp. TaxID=2815808 RepID=UPI002A51EB86|nr:NAD(P)-dependent oxidoreductase [Bullifex sp.]MDD5973249.1 NAD(P)-dependent oxidoreductase [Spirochaetales bacterium]MDD7270479.1 NAD(P)-dependent oxidoreductase [Spirochaetales bacterium]MDY4066477.1 NAD(P)-dependent oxidoreductase [Bullifex sp.]